MKGDNGGDGGDGNININIIIKRGLREESHELRSSMRMSNAYMKQLLLEMPVVASCVRPKCRVYSRTCASVLSCPCLEASCSLKRLIFVAASERISCISLWWLVLTSSSSNWCQSIGERGYTRLDCETFVSKLFETAGMW